MAYTDFDLTHNRSNYYLAWKDAMQDFGSFSSLCNVPVATHDLQMGDCRCFPICCTVRPDKMQYIGFGWNFAFLIQDVVDGTKVGI